MVGKKIKCKKRVIDTVFSIFLPSIFLPFPLAR